MNFLFDTSPQKNSAKRRKLRQQSTPLVDQPTIAMPKTFHFRLIIGRVDDGVACVDQSCLAECHDITDDHAGQWRLECCFCGTGQWIPAIDGRLDEQKKPQAASGGEFVFPEGQRGAGCTVAEYYEKSPNYVCWAAVNEPNEGTRKACEKWLAQFRGIG